MSKIVTSSPRRRADAVSKLIASGSAKFWRADSIRVWLLRGALILGILVVWTFVSASMGGAQAGLPGPVDEIRAFRTTFSEEAAWLAIGQTLRAWAIAFSVAAIVGLLVGAVLGTSKTVDTATRPTVDFIRTIPPIATLPLGALVMGVNLRFEVLFIVIGSVWPILIQTMYGVGNAERGLVDMSRLLRMSPSSRMRFVLIPGAVPFIATGVRLSAVMSFLLAISIELLSGVAGVGSAIQRAQFAGQYAEMYLYVVVATLLGAFIGTFFASIERRVKAWRAPNSARA